MIRHTRIVNIILIIIVLSGSVMAQNDSARTKNPKTAGYFGLLFPGGGQIYNGKYLKAGVIIALEIASYSQYQNNRYNYNNYETLDLPLRKPRYLEKRNKFAWWMGFIYIYGSLDAIVDAHLDKFDKIVDEKLESSETKEEDSL